jgi:CD63 antigen
LKLKFKISLSLSITCAFKYFENSNDLLIFQLSGLTLVITGGIIQGVYKEYLDFLGDQVAQRIYFTIGVQYFNMGFHLQFFNTPVLLIVIGFIVFFVTFFGCCGAIRESHCLIATFTVLLVISI